MSKDITHFHNGRQIQKVSCCLRFFFFFQIILIGYIFFVYFRWLAGGSTGKCKFFFVIGVLFLGCKTAIIFLLFRYEWGVGGLIAARVDVQKSAGCRRCGNLPSELFVTSSGLLCSVGLSSVKTFPVWWPVGKQPIPIGRHTRSFLIRMREYDGRFKDIFGEIYQKDQRKQYEGAGETMCQVRNSNY